MSAVTPKTRGKGAQAQEGARRAAAPTQHSTAASTGLPPYLAAPVQRKCSACGAAATRPDEDSQVQRDSMDAGSPASSGGEASAGAVQRASSASLAQAGSPLPHAQRIQAAFGRHDVSDVRVQVGGPAARAARGMGARAYAQGKRIGFRDQPDVRLAAHEAAHVVQQRRGVHLDGGVGREGDAYERQAASRVTYLRGYAVLSVFSVLSLAIFAHMIFVPAPTAASLAARLLAFVFCIVVWCAAMIIDIRPYAICVRLQKEADQAAKRSGGPGGRQDDS